jgi:hypothetical protein
MGTPQASSAMRGLGFPENREFNREFSKQLALCFVGVGLCRIPGTFS